MGLQLVLTLPKNERQLPFIGVLFENEREGKELNKDLVIDHKSKSYRIDIEYIGQTLNLRLICEELITVRFYPHVAHDLKQLQSWLYLTQDAKGFSFGHVGKTGEQFHIIKTDYRNLNFFLRLTSCKVVDRTEKKELIKVMSSRSWPEH